MTITVTNNTVTLSFELNTDPQPSKSSGKSLILASTGGFIPLGMITSDLPVELEGAKLNLTMTGPLK